jgi:hypothetical protein
MYSWQGNGATLLLQAAAQSHAVCLLLEDLLGPPGRGRRLRSKIAWHVSGIDVGWKV